MKGLKHPATAFAVLALFVALAGTAYASGLISGSQIKNHSIPAKKLTASAIKSLHGQRGPTGPPGPKGNPGPKGDTARRGQGRSRSSRAASPPTTFFTSRPASMGLTSCMAALTARASSRSV